MNYWLEKLPQNSFFRHTGALLLTSNILWTLITPPYIYQILRLPLTWHAGNTVPLEMHIYYIWKAWGENKWNILFYLFLVFYRSGYLMAVRRQPFSPSHSGKETDSIKCSLCTVVFLSLLGQTWLNIISFFVINTVFLYIMFNLKLLLALFHSAILTAIMGISELAVLGMISRFFPHFLLEASVGLVFYTVFSKITFLQSFTC